MASKKDTEVEKVAKKSVDKKDVAKKASGSKAASAKKETKAAGVKETKSSPVKKDVKKDVKEKVAPKIMVSKAVSKKGEEQATPTPAEISADQGAAKVVVNAKKNTKFVKPGNESYATGKRKSSIARVWLRPGDGKFTVNTKTLDTYFTRDTHKVAILKPFSLTKTSGQYNVLCTVRGGGSSGQAGALAHGIAKALNLMAPEFHSILRKAGLLTRDSRVVERKKYGKHKARKSTQFSKR